MLHRESNKWKGRPTLENLNIIKANKLTTEAECKILTNVHTNPSHTEMEAVLISIVRAIVEKWSVKHSPVWTLAVPVVLGIYMGKRPDTYAEFV